MQDSWWKTLDELDDDQRQFIGLPPDGKYVIQGPPGSGKTNLLLLRAKYLFGRGKKDLLFVTFTKDLATFIRTGIGNKRFFDPEQVRTYWSWAREHIAHYHPSGLKAYPKMDGNFEETRTQLIKAIKEANEHVPTSELYDAILIDEAQDLSREEIAELTKWSPRITLAGDVRQGVYERDGLDKDWGYQVVELERHYRIGREICNVADKLLPPNSSKPPLKQHCNYPEHQSSSSARLLQFGAASQQYDALIKSLDLQMRSYPDESIGVLVPKKENLAELRKYCNTTSLKDKVAFHDLGDEENSFGSSRPVHAMTITGSKGVEFKAVHILRAEELSKFPLNRRKLIYTGVTRAKTSLTIYYTGRVNSRIESAFAIETEPDLENLF